MWSLLVPKGRPPRSERKLSYLKDDTENHITFFKYFNKIILLLINNNNKRRKTVLNSKVLPLWHFI